MADSPRCTVCNDRIPKTKLDNARTRGLEVPLYCDNPACSMKARNQRRKPKSQSGSMSDRRAEARAEGRCSLLCGRKAEIKNGERLSRCKECREAQNAARRKAS